MTEMAIFARWLFIILKRTLLRKGTVALRQVLVRQMSSSLRGVIVAGLGAGIGAMASRRAITVPSTRVDTAGEGEI